jgi:hypothetical protein
VYGAHKCSKCTELENNFQDALSELSSSQLIIKLLYKELKETITKLEVMSNTTTGNVNRDESHNRWSTAEYKRHTNAGNNNRVKSTYSPHLPVTITNRYVALSNLSDYPLANEDAAFEVEVGRPAKKMVKTHEGAKNAQNKHYIKYRVPVTPTKAHNRHRVELVNVQEDNTEPSV